MTNAFSDAIGRPSAKETATAKKKQEGEKLRHKKKYKQQHMKTFQGFNLILTDVPSSQIKMRGTTEWKKIKYIYTWKRYNNSSQQHQRQRWCVSLIFFFFFHFSLGRQFFLLAITYALERKSSDKEEKKNHHLECRTRIHKILTA